MGDTPRKLDVDVVRCRDLPAALVRAELDGATSTAPLGTLTGEFSVFGAWYEINSYWEGHFVERILPGAFKRTLNNRTDQSPIRVLLEHGFDPTVGDKPLGVPSLIEERGTGVYAETPLLDTSYNRDLAPALAAGAYGQSFRFGVVRDEWVEPGADGFDDAVPAKWRDLPQRSVGEVRASEFGPTVWPASPSTNGTTGLRSGTDGFYEQLKRRDPSAYEQAFRSVRPALALAAAVPEVPEPEDPQRTHAPDPVEPQERADHSGAPQATHSPAPVSQTNTTPQEETMGATLTMEERSARITEIDERMTEIDSENVGAELRADHQVEWDSLLAERAEHDKAITAQTQRRALLQAHASKPGAGESAESVERNSAATIAAGTPAFVRKVDDIYDLDALRSKARSLDEVGRLMRDNAFRAIDKAKFAGVNREDAQAQVRHLLDNVDDEHGTIARRILTSGSPIYERAFGKTLVAGNDRGLTHEEQRALSLGVATEGGFAVPFQLDPTVILTSDGVDDPIRQLARVEQITGKQWQGITSAGVTVTRKAEAAEATDNSPTVAQPTVDTSRVDGFIPFSVELELAWAALRNELTMLLADGKATEESTTFVTAAGDGTPDPEGVVTGATTTVATAALGSITVNDLTKVKNALGPRFRINANWLATSEFFDHARSLSTDGDVWAELAGDINPRLLGKPTNEASGMPDFALTANAVNALFGDFSKFLIVDRIGMQVELIPHLLGANRRPTGQRGIFAYWFNGSKVLVPNAFRKMVQPAA